jgi:hypothetical protein
MKREPIDLAGTTAVYMDDGSDFDETGDEYRAYYITPGDDDGEPTGKPIPCPTYDAAFTLGVELAERLNVEFVVVL